MGKAWANWRNYSPARFANANVSCDVLKKKNVSCDIMLELTHGGDGSFSPKFLRRIKNTLSGEIESPIREIESPIRVRNNYFKVIFKGLLIFATCKNTMILMSIVWTLPGAMELLCEEKMERTLGKRINQNGTLVRLGSNL